MGVPAKNRERKCSTCRHYQPSPLWRKGWCRNPLLYDRNTNHLVEADSLSCNRTFIDYWEPIQGAAPPAGPQPRGTKPRIAPSIPMYTVDAQGNRSIVTGNTPPEGNTAVGTLGTVGATDTGAKGDRQRRPLNRYKPVVAPVEEEVYDAPVDAVPAATAVTQDPKATVQIEQVRGSVAGAAVASPRKSRSLAMPSGGIFGLSGSTLYLALAALGALVLIAGTMFIMNRRPVGAPAVVPTVTATAPLPTPTGFGDPTPTTPAPPTEPPPPAATCTQLAAGCFAEVTGTANGLVVRDGPTRSAARVTVIRQGTRVKVIDGPQEADGFTWWKIEGFDPADPSRSGWSAGQFLSLAESQAP